MSIPLCVIHSLKVFEYTNLSLANSLIISPSTGFINVGSGNFLSSCSFGVADVATVLVFSV